MGTTPGKSTKVEALKDRVDLRLFNTIVIFDDYTVAKTADEARAALLAAIADGSAAPTEVVSKEVTMANSIRTSKADEKPLVAGDVTDEEFETLKGITNSAAFERFYTRRS